MQIHLHSEQDQRKARVKTFLSPLHSLVIVTSAKAEVKSVYLKTSPKAHHAVSTSGAKEQLVIFLHSGNRVLGDKLTAL